MEWEHIHAEILQIKFSEFYKRKILAWV